MQGQDGMKFVMNELSLLKLTLFCFYFFVSAYHQSLLELDMCILSDAYIVYRFISTAISKR
jgi:hypothetical protein